MSLSSKGNDSLNPVNFYWIASWLNARRSSTAGGEFNRLIVNRSYYAAFLAARNQAKIDGSGARIHTDVIEYWSRKPNKRVANWLRSLKKKREIADYDLGRCVPQKDVGEALRISQQVLVELKLMENTDSNFPVEYCPLTV